MFVGSERRCSSGVDGAEGAVVVGCCGAVPDVVVASAGEVSRVIRLGERVSLVVLGVARLGLGMAADAAAPSTCAGTCPCAV